MSEFAPIKGKCFYWRENANIDDEYDVRLKKGERRVDCSCFVEGFQWTMPADSVPADCEKKRACRYYIPFT